MPIINPAHLLDQATSLATPPMAGAPRQADLRRAISNAYYALFHAIVTQAADDVVGRTHSQAPRYALVYRSIDHGFLRKICEEVVKSTLPARYDRYAPQGGFGPEIVAVATALIDLQEKRHSADYDPLFRVKLTDAALAISLSRSALARLQSASHPRKKAFSFLVLFPTR